MASTTTAQMDNKRHSPQSLYAARWDLPLNNNETPSPNYNDSLISLKANLDRLMFQRTLSSNSSNPNRQSRESGIGSSVGGREEDFSINYSSEIRGLLDQLDTCWNKVQQQSLRVPTIIDRPHPSNDVMASNLSIKERKSIDESSVNLSYSKSNSISNPFKILSQRRHRVIYPPTSPRSSSSSVISLDPATGCSTNIPSSSTGLTLGELRESSSISGWLVKLYVINPSLLARKQWKRRYFCLQDNVLYRFKTSCSSSLPADKLTINPDSIICVSDGFSGKKRVFQVKSGEECWFLQAETTVQLKSWLQGLKAIHANPLNSPSSYDNSTVSTGKVPPKLLRSKWSSSSSMRSFKPNGASDQQSINGGDDTSSIKNGQTPDFSRLNLRRGSEDESVYQFPSLSPSEPTTPTSPPSSIRHPSNQFKSAMKKNQYLTPVMELQDDNESILEMFSSFGKKNHSSHSLNWKFLAASNPTPA